MSKWIKCSERMPENDDTVLTWNGDTFQVDRFDVNGLVHGIWHEQRLDVTHWQPLTEPPAEDE